MLQGSLLIRLLAITASTVFTAALLAPTLQSQALLRKDGDLTRVAGGITLEGQVKRLLAGPTKGQARRGLTSDIPAGTRLLALRTEQRKVFLTLSQDFTKALGPAHVLEEALEQIAKTVTGSGRYDAVFVSVRNANGKIQSLDQLLAAHQSPGPRRTAPPPTLPPSYIRGALSGRTIAVSPGHGTFWHTSLGWTYQRPLIDGLREDFHTNEIAMRYIIPALENMGAEVFSCRERGEIAHQRIGDNDQGSPIYKETGSWSTSKLNGYSNTSYRFTTSQARANATATWKISVPADGRHPVYTFFRAGSNRVTDALYRIHHTGGTSEQRIDQTRNDRRWIHLGDFWFSAKQGARIELLNQSSVPGKVIIADAIRIGAGKGTISRGGKPSHHPRWQEAARYWAQFAGAPSHVYDSSTGEDHTDDVRTRPLYAEWRGADAYISLHTNAGGGSGTSSYIHNTNPTAGSARLQVAVQNQIISDLRREYDPAWVNRGTKSANFGEVRMLTTMPGVLVELAFHDTIASKDHQALHDPRFRYIGGRAYARGVMRHFNPTAAFPPEPPQALRVTQDGKRGLLVAWRKVAGATLYSIEQSADGKGFIEAGQTSSNNWSTGPLPHGSLLSLRVRALNSSGRSFPTEVLTAGTSHTGRSDLLLVQGFDRRGRYVKAPENTKDYLRLHGAAIRQGRQFSLGFDAASNEAITSGDLSLASYLAVDWALGEESTQHQSFSPKEQLLIRSYLLGGGRLLVSGSEIGWDLDAKGSATDRDFYRKVLGATYVRDDANSYAFRTSNAGVFAGLGKGSIDDGRHGTYDVGYADVILPSDGKSQLAMLYGNDGGAAISRIDGNSRVIHLAFPFETITSSKLRGEIMARALRFLLSPRPLEAAPHLTLGKTAPLRIALPREAGATYALMGSMQLGSLSLPGNHILPLAADGLFTLSLQPNHQIFRNFIGHLDRNGRGSGSVTIPALPVLRGYSLYFSGITLRPGPSIQTVLPWVRILLR